MCSSEASSSGRHRACDVEPQQGGKPTKPLSWPSSFGSPPSIQQSRLLFFPFQPPTPALHQDISLALSPALVLCRFRWVSVNDAVSAELPSFQDRLGGIKIVSSTATATSADQLVPPLYKTNSYTDCRIQAMILALCSGANGVFPTG